ncbi:MAG: TIGR04211 family SH3 domain-containing protein [Cycloclasticus sp.]|nr:TIGR04211 family SH3 domain-containing protein [Cycloclasticus sp.]
MLARLLMVLLCLPLLAHSAHITDKLLAGMYAKPSDQEQPVGLLPSGTPVEVLAQKGEFLNIKLVDESTGWVEKRLITETIPANVRLLELQSKYRQLQGRLEVAEQRLNKQQKLVVEEPPAASALLKGVELSTDRSKVGYELLAPTERSKSKQGLGFITLLGITVISLIAGVFLGVYIQDRRQLKKHGGFRI